MASQPSRSMFHLSIPVNSIERARAFYIDMLECREGRSSAHRMDVNFGHHVVMHLAPESGPAVHHFESDGAVVSVRHFGAIVEANEWHALALTPLGRGVHNGASDHSAGRVEEQHRDVQMDAEISWSLNPYRVQSVRSSLGNFTSLEV